MTTTKMDRPTESVTIAEVKAAAAGRWRDICTSMGLPADCLGGDHGPCPKCGGTDRWRVFDDFVDTGGAICNQCGKSLGDGFALLQWWDGCDLPAALKRVGEYLGLANGNGHAEKPLEDAITLVAKSKGIKRESLVAYGALAILDQSVSIPAYGPEGKQCTTFTLQTKGGKGKYQKGKPAGLFFPRVDDNVRLPQPGETWHLVEGVKDAAALHGLEMLACGLNTCHMNAKFAPLFKGANVVIVPDRDDAGEKGAKQTALRLRGIAATVRIAALPAEYKPTDGADVRDVLRAKDGEQLVRAAIKDAAEPDWAAIAPENVDKPTVVVGMDEAEVASEVLTALGSLGWNRESESWSRIYQRVGQLVHVTATADAAMCGVELPESMLRIRPLPAAIIRERIASAVALSTPEDENGESKPLRPPQWLVNAIHQRGQYPRDIRPLSGIVRCPTLRPDGTVVQTPGYDDRTGLLFAPDGEYPPIPKEPTRDDAARAANGLLEVVRDFPFKELDHRSVWLAMVLTLVGRSAIRGPCPMVVIDANCPGTGKSLLTDVAGVIAYGDRLPRKPWPGNDDHEVRKTITSVALEGLPAVLWDNVGDALGCPSLDAALTGTTWTDRILGVNATTGVLPLTTVWCATGNNIVLGADTARRVLYCLIETNLDNPEERQDFAHDNLVGWVQQHRHQLATDAVTILRAYAHAGYPGQKLTTWGSFEAWSNLIRNSIAWLGLPDPWQTRSIVREADRSFELLGLIHDGIAEASQSSDGVTSGQIVELLAKPVEAGKADPHPRLRAAMTEICGAKLDSRKIGNQLRLYLRRVKASRRLCRETSHGGGSRWVVRPVERGHPGDSGDSGDSVPSPCQSENTDVQEHETCENEKGNGRP